MAKDKFFRTVVQVEILSRGKKPPAEDDLSLATIADECSMGDWSGMKTVIISDEVEPHEMADMLVKQGSSPEFLGLKEDGSEDELNERPD